MADYLDVLANDAIKSIQEGYYSTTMSVEAPPASLREAILRCKRTPIISEMKFASPSVGTLREMEGYRHLRDIAKEMEEGGVVGISILTEPQHFGGHIGFIPEVRNHVNVPILMKDIILSPLQIDAASRIGANAVLLIQTLFEKGYSEKNVHSMIDYSHSRGLEVLLEVHTEEEYLSALETAADMVGVNNRSLKTLKVDIEVTKRILTKHGAERKVIVSESGIDSPKHIRVLRKCGAQAFLIGTAIMKAANVREKAAELVEAL